MSPVYGVMLMSGLAPTPFKMQLILLVSVDKTNLYSNLWFSVGWNSTTARNEFEFCYIFKLFNTLKQPKIGSWFI